MPSWVWRWRVRRTRLHRRRNEERIAAETTPVPPLTLFALKALLDFEAQNSNNVGGGTCLAEAGGAKKSVRVSSCSASKRD
jgi:hypothetical protein